MLISSWEIQWSLSLVRLGVSLGILLPNTSASQDHVPVHALCNKLQHHFVHSTAQHSTHDHGKICNPGKILELYTNS